MIQRAEYVTAIINCTITLHVGILQPNTSEIGLACGRLGGREVPYHEVQ